MDNIGEKSLTKYDLNKYCKILAKEFPLASELNSTARQAAAVREACAERAESMESKTL